MQNYNTLKPFRSGIIRMVVLAVALGLLVGFSFFGQPIGLFVPVLTILLLFSLAFLARQLGVMSWGKNSWLVLPVLFFAFMTSIRAADSNLLFNLSALLFLLVWLSHTINETDVRNFGIFDYVWRLFLSCIEITFPQPAQALAEAMKKSQANQPSLSRLLALLRGLVLAAPVMAIFTLLLGSSDPIFRGYVEDLLRFLHLDNLAELVSRLIVSGISAWFILGGFSYALRHIELESRPKQEVPLTKGWLGLTEAFVVLAGVDGLFAAFVAIQFRYFFGGNQNITLEGFTYSEYTRRGFAELIIVAIFSLGLALALQAWTQRITRRSQIGFEALAALLVGFTGIILASAYQRLLLYEEAYGFTQLRTYVHCFMLWVGILLVVYFLTLHANKPRLFVFGLFLTVLGFGASLDILNTDAFIVRANLKRYEKTGQLDVEYLASLSDDAVPGLLAAMDRIGQSERAVLGSTLHYRLDALESLSQKTNWAGWHWARFQALRILSEKRDELESFKPKRYQWSFPIY